MIHSERKKNACYGERVEASPGGRRDNLASLGFIRSAGTILAVTGLAKVWSALTPTKILAVDDPITGLSFGHLLLAVGLIELAIAGVCLFWRSQKPSLMLIACLATNFSVYRLGLFLIGWHRPCSCMGNLTDALHIRPEVADNIMKVVLGYLLIGSYGLLIWQCRLSKVGMCQNQAES